MDPQLQLLLIATAAKIGFILLVAVGAFAPILVWAERRQSAMMQDRIGPVRAGITIFGKEIRLLGLLHPLADALKMIVKEDFIPAKADRLLHAAAPIIALVPAVAAFAIIPFADVFYLDHWNEVLSTPLATARAVPMQIASVDIGILFIFALGGTGVIGGAIAGYASDNKYSLLGGIRSASQMVSYEVVLGLTLVPCFMIYDTLRLDEVVLWQHEKHWFGMSLWGIAIPPLTIAAILFMTAAIAETKRIPFDLPEGESEIVGGYFTEYSGMKFGMFFMGEFIEVVVLACLGVTFFLGGWDLPFLYRSGFVVGDWSLNLPHAAVIGLQVGGFLVKVILLMWLQLMIRWTLPRFRYDQLMRMCWKGVLPLSLLNILFTGILILALES